MNSRNGYSYSEFWDNIFLKLKYQKKDLDWGFGWFKSYVDFLKKIIS